MYGQLINNLIRLTSPHQQQSLRILNFFFYICRVFFLVVFRLSLLSCAICMRWMESVRKREMGTHVKILVNALKQVNTSKKRQHKLRIVTSRLVGNSKTIEMRCTEMKRNTNNSKNLVMHQYVVQYIRVLKKGRHQLTGLPLLMK